jgi:hypothetical protein
MKTSTIAALVLSAFSGHTTGPESGDTLSLTGGTRSSFPSVYDNQRDSLLTDAGKSPSIYAFGEGFCIQGDEVHHLREAQHKDYVSVERTAANGDEYDKAKAEGQREADTIMLNDPTVRIIVVVVASMALIYGWRLERRHTLADAVEDFEWYSRELDGV